MLCHTSANWELHIMGPSSGKDAFHNFEPDEDEITVIDGALHSLADAGLLPGAIYDKDKFNLFRTALRQTFDIPWTGISPRMRRMIYSINAIRQPKSVVGAGIFCGYTFICNAGASMGPGACYESDHLIGLEILSKEAERAARNVANFAGPQYRDTIICADAANWLSHELSYGIDLLYIDAKPLEFDPTHPSAVTSGAKSDYLQIVEAAMSHLNPRALILAHNSVNASSLISDYLKFVRSRTFTNSMNLIIDDAGLEISML